MILDQPCPLDSRRRGTGRTTRRRRACPPVALAILALTVTVAASAARADPPADGCVMPSGYYDSVDTSSSEDLISSLHAVIENHVYVKYSDASVRDAWDVLSHADQDPNNTSNILDVYRNASYPKASGSNANWNKEHSWPQSYGFYDGEGIGKYPHSDCHALFPVKSNYNSSRSDRPYSYCEPDLPGHVCVEKETEENNGQGGDPFTGYPGWSNWRSGAPDDRDIWETWKGRRGDVARALFYLDVRYDGTSHSDGKGEPQLTLVDDVSDLPSSTTGPLDTAYMGRLSDLLMWHFEDPVDAFEMRRNDVVYCYQDNRNPFIDNPGYAYCAFLAMCSADLTVAKDDGLIEVLPGETIVYEIEVGNDGPDPMMGASVSDSFDPTRFDVAGITWSCAPGAGASASAYCPGSGSGQDLIEGVAVVLESGDTVVFSVTAPVLASAVGDLVNTALVTPPAGLTDPDTTDNSDSDVDALLEAGGCGSPESWDVSGRTVTDERIFEACHEIHAGDFRVVAPGGDATLRAGETIELRDGFQVEIGCELAAEIDPALASA